MQITESTQPEERGRVTRWTVTDDEGREEQDARTAKNAAEAALRALGVVFRTESEP